MVVYPSYGIGGPTGASIVVSHTWAQDARLLEGMGRSCEGDYEGFGGYAWGLRGCAVGDEGGSIIGGVIGMRVNTLQVGWFSAPFPGAFVLGGF